LETIYKLEFNHPAKKKPQPPSKQNLVFLFSKKHVQLESAGPVIHSSMCHWNTRIYDCMFNWFNTEN